MQSPRASRSVRFLDADRAESLRHLGVYLWARADSGSGREQLVVREVLSDASEENASDLIIAVIAPPQCARLGVTILSLARPSDAAYCSVRAMVYL